MLRVGDCQEADGPWRGINNRDTVRTLRWYHHTELDQGGTTKHSSLWRIMAVVVVWWYGTEATEGKGLAGKEVLNAG